MDTTLVPQDAYDTWIRYRPIANAATIVLNDSNKVLILRRATGPNKGRWELPSGQIEILETPRQAATRELREETGLDISPEVLHEIGTFRAVNPDKVDIITLFLVRTPLHCEVRLSQEHDTFQWNGLLESLSSRLHPTSEEMLHAVYKTLRPSVTILVPCLNEIEGLPKMLPLIRKEWYDQLIVLDAWSTDGSREWCEANGYTVLKRSKPRLNLWKTYMETFNSGLVRGEVVITFSPDGNSIPKDIPVLVDKICEGYDMVIASRYKGTARSLDDTKLTLLGNRVLTWLAGRGSNVKYTDALNMFRAYRTSIVRPLGLCKPLTLLQRLLVRMTDLYSWEPSLSIRAGRVGLKVEEIPSDEPPAFRPRRQNTFVHGLAILTQVIHEGWLR